MPEFNDPFELFQRGGPVMWVLLFASVAGGLLVIERLLFLHRGQIRAQDFLAGVKNLLRKGRLVEALTVCEETPGPVARVVKAGLLNAQADETRLRLALQEAALLELPFLERRLSSLAALARLAPLLGLLGTVLAALQGFLTLDEGLGLEAFPSYGALMQATGAALLTTAFGLALGLVAQVSYHFLHGRVRALIHDLEISAHDLLQFLLLELPSQFPASEDNPLARAPGHE